MHVLRVSLPVLSVPVAVLHLDARTRCRGETEWGGEAREDWPTANVTSPAPRPAWQAVVDADPTTFVYQTPAALDALCVAHGVEDASRLYEFEDGQRLVLPMYRTAGALGPLAVEKTSRTGSILASQPLKPEELATVSADLAGRPVLRTMVRSSPLRTAGGLGCPRVVGHGLDGADRPHPRSRRRVRPRRTAPLQRTGTAGHPQGRAIVDRRGVAARHGSAARLPAAVGAVGRALGGANQTGGARLYRWRTRRRDPTHLLSVMAETLGTAFTIWLARVDGRPAASIVVLQDGNAHYTNGAMDIDLAGPTRASFLLQKLAIEQACAAGCRFYHFGETGQNAGLARFKSQFGAEAYRLPDYHFERVPITAVTSRGRELARRLIRR